MGARRLTKSGLKGRDTPMRKFILFLILLAIPTIAGADWLFNPHTNRLDYYEAEVGGMTAYTVATLPAAPSDGDAAVVTDGDDAADCTSGAGEYLNMCIYDGGTTAWVIVGDGAGSGNAFTTHDTPAGSDPVASGADTLTWDDTAPIVITGNSTTDTIVISVTDASTSAKGVALFSSDNFADSSGTITIKTGGVAKAEVADADYGDFTISSNTATLDADVVPYRATRQH